MVVGPNGVGKSNLLEAVELLGSLRSHRSNSDQDLIAWGEKSASLKAIANDDQILQLELRRKGGRKAYRNKKPLLKHIDLIGPLKCVGFSSLDLELVRGEPGLRRGWMDRFIQQLEPIYSDLISRYGKLIRQRSQIWRRLDSFPNNELHSLLNVFDVQMALASTRIHRRRKRALGYLEPIAAEWHQRLSQGKENLRFSYLPGSQLEGVEEEETWRLSIEKQLYEQREIEQKSGSCRIGPHRDEIEFLINDFPARRFGSAGQQRTLVLSLKLAELDVLEKRLGEPPILLLDDVLAELDSMRQLMLLEAVGESHQCLISATNLDAFEGTWQNNAQVLKAELLNSRTGFS